MAKARAIIKRLKAVKNIRKITRTMELIATARFKKAMDRAVEAEAYTRKISEIVSDLAATDTPINHPLLRSPEKVSNGVQLVVTSNRGLCGGYNAGVLRIAQKRLRESKADGINTQLEVAGKRGLAFFKFEGQTIDQPYTHFEDKPSFDEVDALATRYIDDFMAGRIDRVDVVYTRFESSARQTAILETLLPFGDLTVKSSSSDTKSTNIEYEFLPSAEAILEQIVPSAFKARLFKCFLDAAVSEQIFRMVAMKGATENADDMIGTLKTRYNRARQSQITSELAEIIGGAAALE